MTVRTRLMLLALAYAVLLLAVVILLGYAGHHGVGFAVGGVAWVMAALTVNR